MAINLTIGENGIISRTEQSREASIIASEKEAISLAYAACKIDDYQNNVSSDALENELNSSNYNTTVNLIREKDLKVLFNDTKHIYILNQDGTINDVSEADLKKVIDYEYINSNTLYVELYDGTVLIPDEHLKDDYTQRVLNLNGNTITTAGIKKKFSDGFLDNDGKVFFLSGEASQKASYVCMNDQEGSALYKKVIKNIIVNGTVMALDNEGKVYTWGSNKYGQVGDGTNTTRNTPICLSDQENNLLNGKVIEKIYNASYTLMAIDNNGNLYTWGDNGSGELGDGSKVSKNTPVCITTQDGNALKDVKVTDVYYYGNTFFAKDNNGKIYSWGYNLYGQVGDGTSKDRSSPICLSDVESSALNNKKIENVYCTNDTSMAIDSENNLYSWGENYGLNIEDTEHKNVPICLNNIENSSFYGKKVSELYISHGNVVVIGTDENLYIWGKNSRGQLGNGTSDYSTESIVCLTTQQGNALFGKKIKQVESLDETMIVIDEENKVYTWGNNFKGEVADGTKTNRNTPVCLTDVQGSPLYNKKIETGNVSSYTSFFIDSDRKVYTAGEDASGQAGRQISLSEQPICISDIEGTPLYGRRVVDVRREFTDTPYKIIIIYLTEDGELIYKGWPTVG